MGRTPFKKKRRGKKKCREKNTEENTIKIQINIPGTRYTKHLLCYRSAHIAQYIYVPIYGTSSISHDLGTSTSCICGYGMICKSRPRYPNRRDSRASIPTPPHQNTIQIGAHKKKHQGSIDLPAAKCLARSQTGNLSESVCGVCKATQFIRRSF